MRSPTILHHDPDVPDESQRRGQVSKKFLCRHLLLHQRNRLAHKELRQFHRGCDLDLGRRAGPDDHHSAGEKPRDHLNNDHNDKELRPYRAARPKCVRERPRGRAQSSNPSFSLNVNGKSFSMVATTHSSDLSGACREAQISYRRAFLGT
jgi:hypothetical protein